MKKIGFVILIIAAIIVPLSLISGAVMATTGYNAYQIVSTPSAEATVTKIDNSKVKVTFSIDRSNMIINDSDRYTNPNPRETKYEYLDNYLIYLVDMESYNAKAEAARKNNDHSAISVLDDEVSSYEVVKEDLYDFGHNKYIGKLEEYIIQDTYVFTADSLVQSDKTYYEAKGAEYVEASLNPGDVLEKGVYYEKVKNTTFSFYISDLERGHNYGIGIQFYYSIDDHNNTRYNQNLQERKEFKIS